MDNQQKKFYFVRQLLDWFARYQRDLPWRKNKNPYHIWVSEIMLQQSVGVERTPCREGTWWLVQILQRMEAGQGQPGDIEKLLDLCENILGRSFCALGDGATSPISSAIKYFRPEFEAAMHTPAWELFPYERSTIFVREPAGVSRMTVTSSSQRRTARRPQARRASTSARTWSR